MAHSHLFVTVLKIITVLLVWILASQLLLVLLGLHKGVCRVRGVLAVKMVICSQSMFLRNLCIATVVVAGGRALSAVVLLNELMQREVCLVCMAHSHLFVTVLKIITVLLIWILASKLLLMLLGLDKGVCHVRSVLAVKMVICSQSMLLCNLRIATVVIAGGRTLSAIVLLNELM